jgi:hypothetical protein
MSGAMNATRETIRTLWSADRKSRVNVFRRADGSFGFLEERYSDIEFEKYWIPYFGETESFCATEDIAMREATSRVAWLAEMLASFEDVDALPRQHHDPAPSRIDGACVLQVNILHRRHRHSGNCIHRSNGLVQGPAVCLAICQYDEDDGYYLFSCDEKWNVLSDTYHSSLDEAIRQAEFEYTGTSDTWEIVA